MLEKGAQIPKKEKDVLDLSTMNPNNLIDKGKIEMKNKMVAMSYITMTVKTNTSMNHVIKCNSPDQPNELVSFDVYGWA